MTVLFPVLLSPFKAIWAPRSFTYSLLSCCSTWSHLINSAGYQRIYHSYPWSWEETARLAKVEWKDPCSKLCCIFIIYILRLFNHWKRRNNRTAGTLPQHWHFHMDCVLQFQKDVTSATYSLVSFAFSELGKEDPALRLFGCSILDGDVLPYLASSYLKSPALTWLWVKTLVTPSEHRKDF